MRELLKTVLSLSLSGSVLILLLLALGPLIQTRLGKGWRYYPWLGVGAPPLRPPFCRGPGPPAPTQN